MPSLRQINVAVTIGLLIGFFSCCMSSCNHSDPDPSPVLLKEQVNV